MMMMTLLLSDDPFLTLLFTFLIAQRITGLYASLYIVHSYPPCCICISLCNILYLCVEISCIYIAVFALYNILYLHPLLNCICILQTAPHLSLCECVPSYLIFVTGATGGARVNFFWPV